MRLTHVLALTAVAVLAPGYGAGTSSGEEVEDDSSTARRAVIPVSTDTGGPGTALTQAEVDSPRPSATRDEMAREIHTTQGRYYVSASQILDALEAAEGPQNRDTDTNDDD